MLLFVLYIMCSTGGLILFKLGASGTSLIMENGALNLKLSVTSLVGMILYLISFLLWLAVIQRNKISYIIPLSSGICYILICAASFFILKETISTHQWIGMGVILIGVVLMNIK